MWSSEAKPNIESMCVSRRSVLVGLTAFSLSACGFEPVLAPGGSLAGLGNRIEFSKPDSRDGFTLRNELEARIGSGSDYLLTTNISSTQEDVGITADQVITRQQIRGRVDFTLVDRRSGATIIQDSVDGFTSYGTTDTTAATAFARRAAYDRLMVIFADKIIARLALIPALPV